MTKIGETIAMCMQQNEGFVLQQVDHYPLGFIRRFERLLPLHRGFVCAA